MAHFNQLVYILFISFLNYALRKVFLLLEKLVRHQYEELKYVVKKQPQILLGLTH